MLVCDTLKRVYVSPNSTRALVRAPENLGLVAVRSSGYILVLSHELQINSVNGSISCTNRLLLTC